MNLPRLYMHSLLSTLALIHRYVRFFFTFQHPSLAIQNRSDTSWCNSSKLSFQHRGTTHSRSRFSHVFLLHQISAGVLIDFGCSFPRTHSNTFPDTRGTPGYQAPEVVRECNQQTSGIYVTFVTHFLWNWTAIDVWSAGTIFFQLLTASKTLDSALWDIQHRSATVRKLELLFGSRNLFDSSLFFCSTNYWQMWRMDKKNEWPIDLKESTGKIFVMDLFREVVSF